MSLTYHCLSSAEAIRAGSFAGILVGMEAMQATDEPNYYAPPGYRATAIVPMAPRSPKRPASSMSADDEAQYTRSRLLTPNEEEMISRLWNHVTTGLMQGILTEHAHITFHEPGVGHLDGLRRIEMQCSFPPLGTPTYRLAAPTPPGYGLTPEQHELIDRMVHVKISINGAGVIDGLIGFRVRDPQTLENFRARFREIMDALRYPTLLPARPIPMPMQPPAPHDWTRQDPGPSRA